MSCDPIVDLAVIAENYAQLTGVLTGFAFTALVLILTLASSRERPTGSSDSGAPLCLFIAFVALLLTTLLYAVLAGENPQQARGRAATVELINGLVFGLAVVALLQGVFLLMRDAAMEPAAVNLARIMTVAVVPTIAMYFVAVGASDTVAARAAANGGECVTTVPGLGVGLTALIAVVLSVSLLPAAQAILVGYGRRSRVVAPLVVFVASTIATIVSGDLSTRTPAFLMSPLVLNLFLVATAVLLTAVGVMFSAAGAVRTPNSLSGGGASR